MSLSSNSCSPERRSRSSSREPSVTPSRLSLPESSRPASASSSTPSQSTHHERSHSSSSSSSPGPPSLPPFLSLIHRIILPLHPTPTTTTAMSSMLLSTMAIHTLSPMRDASALTVGVENIPTLTFVSTLLALFTPDPKRRLIFSRVGLTRGETVGTSLALFYRLFICVLIFFSLAFQLLGNRKEVHAMFYLSVHLLKLHTISLTWGVAQEAMELEEENLERNGEGVTPSGSRLKRLGECCRQT
ncbi:hypothetical protein TL16_g09984 [Triparma laevis f. inornata]|uniref:Uncharacterized protein n=1 Tax=Triparma laevis f. inornata TaxID=1714386 RepID=A0A9W7ENX0_9STRA|nr:hypothetical protein TL16_g09984 [Triparma laevis f. inornata]